MNGTVGERDDVVDDGRLAEQALVRRQRRLGAHLAALAFEAFEQRRLLAADIGAGAHAHFEVEGVVRAGDVRAEHAAAPRRGDRRVQARIAHADIRSGGR